MVNKGGDRGATARLIHSQLTSSFVVHLAIAKWFLKICDDASVKLQGKSEDLSEALTQIQRARNWFDRHIFPEVSLPRAFD